MNHKTHTFRKVSMLLVLLVVLIPTTLGAAQLIDRWSFLGNSPEYVSFIKLVKDNSPTAEVDAAYQKLIDSLPGTYFTDMQKKMVQAKADTSIARYYAELKPKKSNEAKKMLKEASLLLDEALAEGLPESMALVMEADIDSIYYLISSMNVSKGMSSSKLSEKAYELYPNDLAAKLGMANRLLYAPSIGGGDPNRALNIFLEILEDTGAKMQRWDLFTLYAGIGLACEKVGIDDRAVQYLEVAKTLYNGDAKIDSALKKLQK